MITCPVLFPLMRKGHIQMTPILIGVVIAEWLPVGIFVAAAYVFLMFLGEFFVICRTFR